MIVQEKKFKVKKKIVVNLDVCREKKTFKNGYKIHIWRRVYHEQTNSNASAKYFTLSRSKKIQETGSLNNIYWD